MQNAISEFTKMLDMSPMQAWATSVKVGLHLSLFLVARYRLALKNIEDTAAS
jgi:hypothetical protein